MFQVFSSNVTMFLAHKDSQGLTRSSSCDFPRGVLLEDCGLEVLYLFKFVLF